MQEVLVLARRAGKIPEYWVADRRAPVPDVPYFDESAEDVADGIAYSIREAAENFRLDRQLHQPCFVEVLCEAEDLIPRIARVVGDELRRAGLLRCGLRRDQGQARVR